jgi:DNA-binding CsgD family transcriptional regulator
MTADRFIGRAESLAVLREVLSCARSGRGDVVLISGEAGIGKTRLAGELARQARDDDFVVLVGSCVEHGEQVMPLAPVADLVRALATSVSSGELDEIIGPVAGVLGRLVTDLDPAGRSAATAGPLPVGWLSDAVLSVLHRLSSRRPVLVVLEDLQWADESTRQLVAFLAPRLTDHAVALIITYRNDELHRRHRLPQFLVSLQRAVRPEQIELAPFNPDELNELVVAVTQTAPDPRQIAELHERCGGNPFLAEELLASRPKLGGSTTLRDVVLGHTVALTHTQHLVLRAAAAAGPYVDSAVLAAACDLEMTAVDTIVNALVDTTLLVREQDRIRFRHELAREVIEAELVGGERAAVHAALAAALEAAAPERLGEIALHWTLSGDQARALDASIAAGRAAAAVGANPEALLQLERALELWDRVPGAEQRAGCGHSELLLEAADAAGRARSFARAIAHGTRARRELNGDPAAEGLACLRLIEWAWWAEGGEHEDHCRQLVDRAVALVPADPPNPSRAMALAWHARILLDDEAATAVDRATEALNLARATGTHRAEADALTTIAFQRWLDEERAGLDDMRQALAAALRSGDPFAIGRAYQTLAFALSLSGHHDDLLKLEQEALEYCTAAQIHRVFGAHIQLYVIWSLKHLGQWHAAEARVNTLRAEFGGLHLEHLSLAGPWGLILVRQGRLEGVREMIADDLARMGDHRHVLGPAATTAVELAAAEGRLDEIPDLVDATLDRILPRHRGHASELVASALGALADQVPQRPGPSAPAIITADQRRGDIWCARLESVSDDETYPPHRPPDLPARLALVHAELARLHGDPSSHHWAPLVTAWNELDAAYEAAYAQWRLAEALLNERAERTETARSEAQSQLTAAHHAATTMGALPLVRNIEGLARRARLNLEARHAEEATVTASAGPDRFGLTERELDVLRLVADGLTNGQIGHTLYISRKTASVHVSNILRKLGVSSRLEAGTIAARTGLSGI